ncbi:hypothetical protein PInf_022380 [Phytophthora infestans]|nr:hypothetical protein PInf_022380 [Phytophthora infestans]
MVRVSGAANWWFNVSGVQIEPVSAWTPNFAQYGTGVQFPWENRPWNNHSTRLLVQDFLIDKRPVTNAQYSAFLKASGYSFNSLDRFLLHWENRQGAPASWTVSPSLAHSPVVNVALENAQAYAKFYRERPKEKKAILAELEATKKELLKAQYRVSVSVQTRLREIEIPVPDWVEKETQGKKRQRSTSSTSSTS